MERKPLNYHQIDHYMKPGTVDTEQLDRCAKYMHVPRLVLRHRGDTPAQMVRLIRTTLGKETYARNLLPDGQNELEGKLHMEIETGWEAFVTDMEAAPPPDDTIIKEQSVYLKQQSNGESPMRVQASRWLEKIEKVGLKPLEGLRRYLAAQMHAIFYGTPLDSGKTATWIRPSQLTDMNKLPSS